jgi:hypothetical protein
MRLYDKKAQWFFRDGGKNKFLAFATSFNAFWFENFRDLKDARKKSLNKCRMVPAGNALGVLSKKAHILLLKISGIKRRK